jgi:hypothetical protein
MTWPHLHLVLNHLPIVGVPFVLLLLGAGLLRGSRDLVRAALVFAVGLAVLIGPVFQTGEEAEEGVEHLAWVKQPLIEAHSDKAELALAAVLVTGAVAALGLFLSRGGRPLRRVLSLATGVGLLVSLGLLVVTGEAGGRIRHDELRGASAPATSADPFPDGAPRP